MSQQSTDKKSEGQALLEQYAFRAYRPVGGGEDFVFETVAVPLYVAEAALSSVRSSKALPTELQVKVGALTIAASPLIDAPKLPYEAWMGLSRHILESAMAVQSAIERNTDPHGLLPLLAPFYGMTPMDAADVLRTLIKDAERYRARRFMAYYLGLPTGESEADFDRRYDEASDADLASSQYRASGHASNDIEQSR